jgi:hypothetical protein
MSYQHYIYIMLQNIYTDKHQVENKGQKSLIIRGNLKNFIKLLKVEFKLMKKQTRSFCDIPWKIDKIVVKASNVILHAWKTLLNIYRLLICWINIWRRKIYEKIYKMCKRLELYSDAACNTNVSIVTCDHITNCNNGNIRLKL